MFLSQHTCPGPSDVCPGVGGLFYLLPAALEGCSFSVSLSTHVSFILAIGVCVQEFVVVFICLFLFAGDLGLSFSIYRTLVHYSEQFSV